jgi:hypothetical protein
VEEAGVSQRTDFIAEVTAQIGVRYTFGGSNPRTGFDCSGLLFWAAGQVGLSIPRTSQAQWGWNETQRVGTPIPGDLVFFDVPEDGPPQPQHVGMVSGSNQMIDAPHTGTVVRRDPIAGFSRVMGYGRLPFAADPVPVPPPALSDILSTEVLMALAASQRDAFNEFVRERWYALRTDGLLSNSQDSLWLAYETPIANGGFGGSIDLVLARIHDDAVTHGTLRP